MLRLWTPSDPLREYVDRFVGGGDVVAYLDGNSLGRPLKVTAERAREFVLSAWGGRLIRGWDEGWFELPLTLGDRLGAAVLGAAPGQTAVGDSTSVLLYKLARAALALRPDRTEIVVDRANFPTDRYLAEGIAAETGARLRWLDPPLDDGVDVESLAEVVSERTAVVLLSHVATGRGICWMLRSVSGLVRSRGALLLLDVCHSAGSVPVRLDEWGVDFAVGCTYKYLNGGPGSPAFAYVAERHLSAVQQPIWGWMGAHEPFEMAQGYVPASGIRRILSGTPAVYAMQPMADMLDAIEEVGIDAIRAKSIALTSFALEMVQEWLVPLGVTVSSPLDASRRGGHITVDHPSFRSVTAKLWRSGVIPDFRRPQGIRLGLSPLSTRFVEVERGVAALRGCVGAGDPAARVRWS